MNSIVQKPWGEFQILISGENYLVKKISVKPNGILSLQSHKYRAEHWLIAKGEAEVTVNNKVLKLKENEHIFISKGALHRVANKNINDLEIIEMWYGEILDENDIKRYEDIYGRIIK